MSPGKVKPALVKAKNPQVLLSTIFMVAAGSIIQVMTNASRTVHANGIRQTYLAVLMSVGT